MLESIRKDQYHLRSEELAIGALIGWNKI